MILKLRYDLYYSKNNGWILLFELTCWNYEHVTIETCISCSECLLLLSHNILYAFDTASWTLMLFKMKRVFSRGTVFFLWLGFALFFFVAQISIFRVTSHVDKTSIISSLGSGSGEEAIDEKALLKVHVPLHGRCMLRKQSF